MNALTPVITKDQARQITGGRTPLMPVEYETAVKALEACMAIDEAKIWSDKADALAAWAKIYHSQDAERKARQLKIHAYKRMGELAEELRPRRRHAIPCTSAGGIVNPPLAGPRSLLVETGLTQHQAAAALELARTPVPQVEEIIQRPRVPSPTAWMQEQRGAKVRISSTLSMMAPATRQISPREFLKDPPGKGSPWRENAEEVYTWLTVVLQKRN